MGRKSHRQGQAVSVEREVKFLSKARDLLVLCTPRAMRKISHLKIPKWGCRCAQGGQGPVHERDKLSSDPQHPQEKPAMENTPITLVMGRWRLESGALQPGSRVQTACLRFSETPPSTL